MVTIKAYTDLEQSRKLSEFLPLESADMVYVHTVDLEGDEHYDIDFRNNQPLFEDDILVWSLAALRNLIPVGIKVNENTYLFESHNTFDKSWVYRYYNEDDTSYLYCKNVNEVDACYELILKLNELNLL